MPRLVKDPVTGLPLTVVCGCEKTWKFNDVSDLYYDETTQQVYVICPMNEERVVIDPKTQGYVMLLKLAKREALIYPNKYR